MNAASYLSLWASVASHLFPIQHISILFPCCYDGANVCCVIQGTLALNGVAAKWSTKCCRMVLCTLMLAFHAVTDAYWKQPQPTITTCWVNLIVCGNGYKGLLDGSVWLACPFLLSCCRWRCCSLFGLSTATPFNVLSHWKRCLRPKSLRSVLLPYPILNYISILFLHAVPRISTSTSLNLMPQLFKCLVVWAWKGFWCHAPPLQTVKCPFRLMWRAPLNSYLIELFERTTKGTMFVE